MDKKKLAEMEKAHFEQLLEDLSTPSLKELLDLLLENPGDEVSEAELPDSGQRDERDESD